MEDTFHHATHKRCTHTEPSTYLTGLHGLNESSNRAKLTLQFCDTNTFDGLLTEELDGTILGVCLQGLALVVLGLLSFVVLLRFAIGFAINHMWTHWRRKMRKGSISRETALRGEFAGWAYEKSQFRRGWAKNPQNIDSLTQLRHTIVAIAVKIKNMSLFHGRKKSYQFDTIERRRDRDECSFFRHHFR